jgi:hypothetical protein
MEIREMSERLSAFQTMIRNLAGLPGLGFLLRYVDVVGSSRAQFDNTKGDYEGYVHTVKGLGGDAKKVVQGSGARERPASAEDPEAVDPHDDPERP